MIDDTGRLALFEEAIESLTEGFAMWDAEDRLILCNSRYREIYADIAHTLFPGARYVDTLKARIESPVSMVPPEEFEARLAERLLQRRSGAPAFDVRRAGGQWIRVIDRVTRGGGVVAIRIDVSDIKRREAEAANQSALLQATLENISDGILAFDSEFRLEAWNDLGVRIPGLPQRLVRRGALLVDLVRGQIEDGEFGEVDVEAELERRAGMIMTRRLDRYERTRPDGTILHITRNPTPTGGFVTTFTDVTGRRNAEEEAKRREQVLIAVTGAAARILAGEDWFPQARALLAHIGEVLEVSRVILTQAVEDPTGDTRYRDLFLWSAQGVAPPPLPLPPALDALRHSAFRDWWARRAAGEIDQALTRTLDPDKRRFLEGIGVKSLLRIPIQIGDRLWGAVGLDDCLAERVWKPIDLDTVRAAVNLIAIAIQRHRAESVLRDREETYRRLFEVSPDGILITEYGSVVAANPAAVRIFGAEDPESMVGLNAYELIHERHREAARQNAAMLRLTGQPSPYSEISLLRLDGTEFIAEAGATLVSESERRRIQVVLRDITEKRAAQAEIERQRDALHQGEKLAALGTLLAGVAHELNNPLTVVMGQAALLREIATDPKVASGAERIHGAAERCARIVRTFLAMARRRPPVRSDVALADAIRSALDVTAYALKTGDVAVVIDVPDDLPTVSADADQISQLLLNLIVNAQQEMMSRAPPRVITISAGLAEEGGAIAIRVADNGAGVPEEIRGRIFEPFFTTKPAGVGTGVGLSVCHAIAEAHGGRILVEDAPGGGAAFVVVLPLGTTAGAPEESAPEGAAGGARRPPPGVARGSVLVVDDEAEIRSTLSAVLAADGHRTSVAGDGEEALALIERQSFEAILCDIRMPRMDGIAFYRMLAAKRPDLVPRLVFLTGDALGADIAKVVAETGIPLLEKPAAPEAVRRAVATALSAPPPRPVRKRRVRRETT